LSEIPNLDARAREQRCSHRWKSARASEGLISSRAIDQKAHPQNHTGFPDMPLAGGADFFSRALAAAIVYATPFSRCTIYDRFSTGERAIRATCGRIALAAIVIVVIVDSNDQRFANEGSRVHVTQLDRLIRDTFGELRRKSGMKHVRRPRARAIRHFPRTLHEESREIRDHYRQVK